MPEKKSFGQKIMQSWLWGPIGIGITIFTGLVVVVYIFRNILFTPGLAPGSDVTSFAHTAAYIVDYLRAHHHFPQMDLSWYAGFELFHAPPMINYFLGIIYYFTHDIYLTTRIFHPLAVAIVFLGMFWLMKKEKYSTLNAFIAGMIFIFMPTILLSLWSYTKIVALFFWPFGLYFTNKILTTNHLKYIVYLAITIALMVYSHPMMASSFGLMMIFYSTMYAILDRRIVTRRFFWVILAVGLGFLLTSKYLIPFFLEGAGRLTVSPKEQIPLGGIRQIFVSWGYLTLILPLLPMYVVWRRRQSKLTALYLTEFLVFLIFLGYYFLKFRNYFPFNEIYYYVWYFNLAFLSAYLLGLLINGNVVKNLTSYFVKVFLGIIFILMMVYFANHPSNYLRYFNGNEDPKAFASDNKITEAINKMPNLGRIYISHYPFGFINWFLWVGTDKPNIEGHYLGIARINKQISHIADAIHYQYPNYVFNKLKHLNTRYFIANSVLGDIQVSNGDLVGQKFLATIPKYGYQLILNTKGLTNINGVEEKENRLYYLDKPSTYVMPVEEKILIIGKYSPTLAMAISPRIKAVEGGSDYLDDYDQEFLKHFKTVVLYGFTYHDKTKAEAIAREYVKGGGNLVIEMFNMGISPLAENPNFLGVSGFPQKIKEPIDLEILKNANGPLTDSIPRTFTLPGEIYDTGDIVLPYIPMEEWNSLEYAGLDQSLARLSNDADNFSILGYKNIDGGKVTFVGMNIFYHLFLTHDQRELNLITSLIKNSNYGNNNNSGQFSAEQKALTSEYLKFEINNDQERLLLISMSYSAHWKAHLDGKPITIRPMEDLMVIQVPAGNYTLDIKYESTPITIFAWLVTIGAIIFLMVLLIFSKFLFKKDSKIEALKGEG